MSLSDLASIGSVLSSIAVCGSLIYLALQVRQSDRNQRTVLQQGTSARNIDTVWRMGSVDHARLVAKAANGDFNFTNEQAVQLSTFFRAMMLGFEDLRLLRKLSLVDEMQLDTQERGLRSMLSIPALRALWAITRDGYSPEFAVYVDEQMKHVPAATNDYSKLLNAATADIVAGIVEAKAESV